MELKRQIAKTVDNVWFQFLCKVCQADDYYIVLFNQKLPGRSIGVSLTSENLGSDLSEEDLPLPPNWAVEVTPEGIR
ncbi:unnamed protein product [Gongylonema pulchrum]|uniref:Phage tail protein n=1 Tax=Gongylonema pulchrum TaxID=637853 RepID=A0A183D2U2_9BILA|nr:unnamed protein product [Gongylonema pulchrum]